MPLRKNIRKILEMHADKGPEILARMIIGFLVYEGAVNPGNGWLEDDELYTEQGRDKDLCYDDYKSIGMVGP